MLSFSQRKGLKPIKTIMQVDDMDADLRIRLWNLLTQYFWEKVRDNRVPRNSNLHIYLQRIWDSYFPKPLDNLSTIWSVSGKILRQYFFDCKWNEVYDFIEFSAHNYPECNWEFE